MTSGNSQYRIELLSRNNYDTWVIQAQAVLVKNGLWKTIDDPKPDAEKDMLARSELFLLISPTELRQVKCCTSASEIWKKLKSIYQSEGPARKAALLKQLILKKMSDEDDILDHMSAIFDSVDRLQNMDVKVNDDLLSIIILYSLPISYENFRIAIETRDKLPLPEELKIKIIEESQARTRNSNHNAPTESAYYFNKKKLKCTVCDKVGHQASKCWSRNKNQSSSNNKKNKFKNFFISEHSANLVHTDAGDVWCLDSGSTSHMTGSAEKFHSIEPKQGKLKLASDQSAQIKGSGTVQVSCNNSEINLNDTLYVPELSTNLLSVARITERDHTVLFTKNKAYVKDDDGKTVLTANKKNGLYLTQFQSLQTNEQANNVSENDLMKWHKKLAHLNEKDIKMLSSNNLVSGLDLNKNDVLDNCESCIQGKMSRLPFPKHEGIKSKQLLEIIHTDLCGPMPQPTIGGSRYILTFIDDFSRYCYVYFLQKKSETLEKFKEFKEEVEKLTENKIKYLQSDNGTEYCNKDFDNYLKENGIQRRLTVIYTAQQNGLAERKNRTLVEKARCMMIESKVPETLWAEAIATTNYIVNRCPAKALNGETPYMKWVGRIPSVKHLHIFGSKVFTLHKQKRHSKFSPKASECVFIGYAKYSKAYRIYLPKKNTVIVRRDVKVLDGKMYYQNGGIKDVLILPEPEKPETEKQDINKNLRNIQEKRTTDNNLFFQPSIFQQTEDSDDDDDESMKSFSEYEDDNEVTKTDTVSPQNVSSHPQQEPCQSTSEQIGARNQSSRPVRMKKPPVWSKDYELKKTDDCTYLCEETEESDIHSNEWQEAIKAEIKAHIKNGTWKIQKKEDNSENIVDYKMILKEKIGPDENIIKKARLVARGFTQRPGIDYNETYAPVAKPSSIRTLLAHAVEQDLKLHQMDVTTAYLNGDLNEKILMKKPENLEEYIAKIMLDESENENLELFYKARNMLQDISKIKGEKVCLLKKALYGLKQAGRQWFYKLDYALKNMNFKASTADPCIYTWVQGTNKIILAVYVDDLIIAYSNENSLTDLKKQLNESFEMKDIGKLKNILGLEISYEKNQLKITQRRYIQKALKKYNMENCKPISTPIEPYLKLEKSENCDKNIPYQNLIGTLMYLAVASRPDIAYSVSYLSQFNNAYSEEHFKYAKRILRYLKGTIDVGICYTKSYEDMYGMADADWAGCKIDRRSYSGYCFKYANGCISWESKKQRCVALSTAEAEYIALTEAAKEAIHLKMLFSDLGININNVVIFSDNQAAQVLSKNPVISGKSKHIEIKQHFIRDCVQQGLVSIQYKPTQEMEADILTKGVPGPRLLMLRGYLGLS